MIWGVAAQKRICKKSIELCLWQNNFIELRKGQLISKQNCQAVTSPKKQTKLIILNIFSTQDSELRSFLGVVIAWQFCFEINWPLVD